MCISAQDTINIKGCRQKRTQDSNRRPKTLFFSVLPFYPVLSSESSTSPIIFSWVSGVRTIHIPRPEEVRVHRYIRNSTRWILGGLDNAQLAQVNQDESSVVKFELTTLPAAILSNWPRGSTLFCKSPP